jgi:triacylglycerol lipase
MPAVLPPGFDRDIALECATLIGHAYARSAEFLTNRPWQLPDEYQLIDEAFADGFRFINIPEPFGFVVHTTANGPARTFVVFRGTRSIEDWLANASVPTVSHPWGGVHQGFDRVYRQCSARIQAAVGQVAGASTRVVVTGHSLGGALATLAAADLVVSGVAPAVELYSYASPRVGDLGFAANFNPAIPGAWRIANSEDIVTTVPLASPALFGSDFFESLLGRFFDGTPALSFEHVGTPVYFTSHGGDIAANHEMARYQSAL